jgi:hypothetical protein
MATGIYRIELDGRWDLRDLYEFPHAFLQAYSFIYAFDSDLDPRDYDRINYALESYPWRGGYSIVNIYQVLKNQVEPEFRPVIKEIHYASPGWIELFAHLHPAVQIAMGVASIAGSAAAVAKAYSTIQNTLYGIRLRARQARVEHIQLSRAEVQELTGLTHDLANSIGFSGTEDLIQRTGSAEVAAKLVSAHYRRLKILSDFVVKGKARLPTDPGEG